VAGRNVENGYIENFDFHWKAVDHGITLLPK
jgi:hypothetical protein